MTRPIKFRAWDGSRMRAWGKYDDGSFIGPPSESGSMEYPQMQFTGLLDKNGKEIYEGDILGHHQDKRCGSIEWGKAGFIVNEGKNWVEKLDSWCYPLDTSGKARGEVIGNIYENPNLLKP